MAGSRPGESNGGTTGSIPPLGPRVPALPADAISFVHDYDVPGVVAMLSSFSHCSVKEQIEVLRKNLESFKKPYAVGAFPKEEGEEDEYEDYDYEVDEVEDDRDEDDEVDEDENDEKGDGEDILKFMVDGNKLATDGQRQVPNDGEREYKKPRLAEACQGGAEGVI